MGGKKCKKFALILSSFDFKEFQELCKTAIRYSKSTFIKLLFYMKLAIFFWKVEISFEDPDTGNVIKENVEVTQEKMFEGQFQKITRGYHKRWQLHDFMLLYEIWSVKLQHETLLLPFIGCCCMLIQLHSVAVNKWKQKDFILKLHTSDCHKSCIVMCR